jgi:AraC family transcriptional regulator
MEFEIHNKPAFTVVGLRYYGRNEKKEIPALWETFVPRMGEIPNPVPKISYGVMDNFDPETGEFEYIAGLEVQGEVDLPEGMISVSVPAQTYAVFPCTLPTLMETFKRIAEEGLPTSEYRRAAGPEFEFYGPDFHPDLGRLNMTIYIPVEKIGNG